MLAVIFAISIIVIGYLLQRSLKKHYLGFYKVIKNEVRFIQFVAFSLGIATAAYRLPDDQAYHKEFDESVENNTWFAPVVTVVS